jgi:hypothetical protein
MKFKNQDGRKEISFIGEYPKVKISIKAYLKIKSLVSICDEEVGWLGIVKREDTIFLLSDIYIVKQEVQPTFVELDENALGELGDQLLQEEDGMEKYNNLRFWGHSHVDMNVLPSVVDDNQTLNFLKSVDDYFLMGIFNKRGNMYFSVIYKDKEITISDLDWEIYFPEEEEIYEEMKKEKEEKVKKYEFKDQFSSYIKRCPVCDNMLIFNGGCLVCYDEFCSFNYKEAYEDKVELDEEIEEKELDNIKD